MHGHPIYPTNFDEQGFLDLIRLLTLRDRSHLPLEPTEFSWEQQNTTDVRTFNGSTATLADVINVLGTLIKDLKSTGVLR